MSLGSAYFDSLPYIDKEPTPQERAAAEALIAVERSTLPPPPGPEYPEPRFTSAMAALLDACAARGPDGGTGPLITAIDLSRYEDPVASDAEILAGAKRVISSQDVDADGNTAADNTAVQSPLHKLCAAHAYLTARRENLTLMEVHGANAWLLANYHIEAEVRALELEAEEAKRAVDELADARRRAQDAVAGEMATLEDGWRKGVERMLGTQVAVEMTRAEVRDRMRAAVQ